MTHAAHAGLRIDRLRLEAFGQFEGHDLELRPGLNVLHGANEAGKSTVLAFTRAMLFGFEKKRVGRSFAPEQGSCAGEARLSTHFGSLWIRRSAGRRRSDGELLLRCAEGNPLPESKLSDALAGISRELFFEVFAFGLDALASFERLAEHGSVSEALFAAGMQGAQRLPDALDALRRSAELTFRPRAVQPRLNAVLLELDAVQQRLRDAGDRPARYAEELALRSELEQRLEQTEARCALLAREHAGAVRLAAAGPELERLAVARATLAALPELSAFPAGGTERLAELQRLLELAVQELEDLRARQSSLRRELETLPAPAVQDLRRLTLALRRFESCAEERSRIPGRAASLGERQEQVRRAASALGLGITVEALVGWELGAAARLGLVTLRDRLDQAERQLEQREVDLKGAKAEKLAAAEEARRAEEELGRLPSASAASVRARLQALARVGRLERDLAHLTEQRAEKDRAAHQSAPVAEPLPRHAFPLTAAACLSVLVFGLVAQATPSWGTRESSFTAAAGALLLVLIGVLHRRAGRAFAEQREAVAARQRLAVAERSRWQEEAEALALRIADLRAARAEALAIAEVDGEPTERELEARTAALSQGLSAIERRERLETEREALQARLSAASRREAEASAAQKEAAARLANLFFELEAALVKQGFPRNLSAEAALDLWSSAASVRQRWLDLAADQAALDADRARVTESSVELVAAAAAAGLEETGDEATAQAARASLAEQERLEGLRADLSRRTDLLQAQLQRAERHLVERREALEALLTLGGAVTAEGFFARALQAEAFASTSAQVRELAARVSARTAMGPEAAATQLAALGGAAAAASRAEALGGEVSSLELERKQLAEALGSARERLRSLETDEAIAALRSEEETLLSSASELASGYVVDRLALGLLHRARRRYEQEQQPKVIQRASAIFAELTSERYVRVYLSAGGKDLFLRDASGKEWAAEQLSRGTREQLYLAFRLAVIEDFADARWPLPILVDDILVNFDPPRTATALQVLARFAQRHQVIAFTCHPSLREQLRAQGAHPVEIAQRPRTLLEVARVDRHSA